MRMDDASSCAVSYNVFRITPVWFAKTLADFEINDLAALTPLFCL
jgi:hypothetical protein